MQTIGERLEEARKRKGVSLREAAEATKIRSDYLQKFESNQFDLGLAELYVRGFLRSYAQFLKLPTDKIVNDFNGLGLSAGGRNRTPNREVYGRMDLTVASTENASTEETAPAAAAASSGSAPPAPPQPSRFSRSSPLPRGPVIDPNLVIKGGLVLAGLVVVVLIFWGIKAMLGSSKSADSLVKPVAMQPAQPSNIALTALGPVSIQVAVALKSANGATTSGEMIIPSTSLKKGETRTVPLQTSLIVTAKPPENLQVKINGSPTTWPANSEQALIQAPGAP